MRPVRILHLEDSLLDHELIRQCIVKNQAEVQITQAASRLEFLRLFGSGRWDMILADYELPDYDGLSALSHVRQTASYIPFIFVSGVLGEEIAIETLKSGATDYVLKTRLARLIPAIERALHECDERDRRREAEEALEETEHRFEAMANSAPVLIWVAGPEKQFHFFNRGWLDFTGKTAEERQDTWTESLHPDDLARWSELFNKHFEERSPLTVEIRLRRFDGAYRWLVVNASPRFSGSVDFLGFTGLAIDLTEIKQTEERLRHVAKLESLGVLAGGIAHDFNNLLTGIIGHADLLKDSSLVENDLALIDNILAASNAAAQLTRQMLAYSGRGLFVIEKLDFSALVRENKTLIDASIPRNVRLEFDLSESLAAINADTGQAQQVVMNLIINAGEASEQSSGTVSVRTYAREISSSQNELSLTGERLEPGRYIVFEVADTGVGMSVATQARIFDPFFTTKFTGRGLGLAAVLGIVRGHKGGIQLRSELGKGTTFTVLFPQANQTEFQQAQEPSTVPASKDTVLIVDDEPLVSNAARIMLVRHGFAVLTASNGAEALDKLTSAGDAVDVVLLDMIMPVMGGQDTLLAIRASHPALPVVGMSGFGETEAIQRFGSSLDRFIEKPFTTSRLIEVVSEAMAVGCLGQKTR